MQAPSKSRASAVAAPEALPTLVRLLVALMATVTLLFILRPAIVHAQQTVKPTVAKPAEAKPPAAHATHATTTGSAQGALAEQTAGKGDAAPKEPAKAAPRSVRPSTTRAAVSNASPVNVPSKTAAPAKTSAELIQATEASPVVAAATAVIDDSEAFAHADLNSMLVPRIWGPDGATMRGARGAEETTVFLSRAIDAAQADVEVEMLLPVKTARARSGEYAGAPYAVSGAAFGAAGFVGNAASTSGQRTPKRMQLLDEVEITVPTGTVAEVGQRFVTVDGNRLFKSTVQIAVPTGVLEVVKAEAGRAPVARVVQQTGAIQEGQRLLPLEGSAIVSSAITPVARLSNAPETDVIWIDGAGLLPSLQSFVVLGAGEKEGVKAGDQFALVTRKGLGPDAIEQRIAVVRVVRVTAFGSSAIVVRQDQPGIGVGTAARLIGRVQ